MPPGNSPRLLKLADREFRQLTGEWTAKTYADAADCCGGNLPTCRRIARLLDTAGGRLSVVLTRCNESTGAPAVWLGAASGPGPGYPVRW